MNRPKLLAKIEDAEQQIGIAEAELAKVIRELGAAPRADKTISSDVIDGAFDKLSAAKAKVSELKTLIDEAEA